MTDSRPLILITNDDGIEAPGLFHLIDCVAELGDIVVVAPARPQSGQSSAFTVNAPLRVRDHADYHGATMHSVDGTPVDCVKLSMHHILPRRPDMLLSGINHGSNAGNSLIYSGTMGAALEGCRNEQAVAAEYMASLQEIDNVTSQILTEVQGLMGEINRTSDMKGASELQAQIQAKMESLSAARAQASVQLAQMQSMQREAARRETERLHRSSFSEVSEDEIEALCR